MRRRTLLGGAGAMTMAGLVPAVPAAAEAARPGLEQLLFATEMPASPFTDRAKADAAVASAGRAFRDARYAAVTEALPQILVRLHCTDDHLRNVPLSRAYVIGSSLATKHGDDALALAMADRAQTYALASGDQLVLTAATHALAIALRRDGHQAAAVALLTKTAERLDTSGNAAPQVLAGFGSLLCTAAYASAQAADPGNAHTYITEATDTARRLNGREVLTGIAPFSATTVAIYQIGVQTTLGDTAAALTFAASVNPASLPTPERAGRYLVDTARAWCRHGRVDEATHALLAAEARAPEEVDRSSVRELVTTLLYSPIPTSNALRGLAVRIGVQS